MVTHKTILIFIRKYFLLSLWLLLITFSSELYSQSFDRPSTGLPLKEQNEFLFGKDITINDEPSQNQRNIAICSAFNGWLYVAYTYHNNLNTDIQVMRSTDNGMTWSTFLDIPSIGVANQMVKLDLVALGRSLDSLKIVMGISWYDTVYNGGGAGVPVYNGQTGEYIRNLADLNGYNIGDFNLCTDGYVSATNTNPGVLAILYTHFYSFEGIKYVKIKISDNEGVSFNSTKVISIESGAKNGKVSLAFGKSATFNAGRFFATWESRDYESSSHGHIFSSHSEPSFNSDFTPPFCIDSLTPTTINQCSYPSISCQNNDYDNVNSNLTTLILFEKYDEVEGKTDIAGYYNLQSTFTNNFEECSFTDSTTNNLSPFSVFNQYDNSFLVSYFNQTALKLPLLQQDVNMTSPNQWTIVENNYNDNANIIVTNQKMANNE